MEENQEFTFSSYFDKSSPLMIWIALHPYNNNSIFVLIQNIVILTNDVLLFTLGAFTIFTVSDTLKSLEYCACVSLVLIIFIKKLIFIYYKENFRSMLEDIERMGNQMLRGTKACRNIYKNALNSAKFVENTWFFLIAVGSPVYIIQPVYHAVSLEYKVYFLQEFNLPIVDNNLKYKTPLLEILYVLTYLITFHIYSSFLGWNSLFAVYVMHPTAQLNWISYQLKHLFRDTKTSEQTNKRMKEIVQNHYRVIIYKDKLEKALSPYLVVSGTIFSIILCTSVFSLLYSLETGEREYQLLGFAIGSFFQMHTNCSLGQKLIDASEEVGSAAYSCGWENFTDKDIRKFIMLLIMRSQKPLALTAKGLFSLQIATFSSFLNTSYSLVAFLRSS